MAHDNGSGTVLLGNDGSAQAKSIVIIGSHGRIFHA